MDEKLKKIDYEKNASVVRITSADKESLVAKAKNVRQYFDTLGIKRIEVNTVTKKTGFETLMVFYDENPDKLSSISMDLNATNLLRSESQKPMVEVLMDKGQRESACIKHFKKSLNELVDDYIYYTYWD